jgi:hypothetical protein
MTASGDREPAGLALPGRVHKRVFGLAVGLTTAMLVFGVTAFEVAAGPTGGLPLELLSQYFYGYRVSWLGACVGAWWALVAGFAAGWFAAFLHNLAFGIWLFSVRVRADLHAMHDLFDHL